jgi:diketogulonate reductase-like aldo/keto reductase
VVSGLKVEFTNGFIAIYSFSRAGIKTDHPDNRKYRKLTWSVLSKLHKQGLLRSIGVSNFNIRHLQEFLSDVDTVRPAVNQVEWHPYYNQPDLENFCRQHNIFLQAYSSLGSSNYATLRLDTTVLNIAEKLHKSPSQILLRWAFQQNIGILPKGSSKAHIEENIALDFEIPEEFMQVLDNMKISEKFAWNPEAIF